MSSIFVPNGRNVWVMKVPSGAPAGGKLTMVKRSTETDDKHDAYAIAKTVKELERTHKAWDIFEHLGKNTITLPALHRLWREADCNVMVLRERLNPASAPVVPVVPRLLPLMEKWKPTLYEVQRDISEDTAAHYFHAVRSFVTPEKTTADFTRLGIKAHFGTMTGAKATIRKHAAGLSDFAAWLEERNLIDDNPVRGYKLPKPAKPRDKYLTTAQVLLMASLKVEPYASLDIFMAATGADLETALTTVVADVTLKTKEVHLRGTKQLKRDRMVRYGTYADPTIRALCAGKGPAVQLFDTIPNRWNPSDYHRERMKALSAEHPWLTGYWLKDHRHTFGVRLARAGATMQLIADAMGNTLAMATTVYTKYKPTNVERAAAEGKAARLDKKALAAATKALVEAAEIEAAAAAQDAAAMPSNSEGA